MKAKKKARVKAKRGGYRIFIDFPNIHEIVDAKGKRWRFEWHAGAGLLMVDKDDNIVPDYPPDDSAFWPAFNLWDAGRRAGRAP